MILSPVPQMQSTIERLPTGPNINISIIPPQHLQLGHVTIPIAQIGHLVVPIMLSETFLAEGRRQHIVEESALVDVDIQYSSIRFCREDGIERFSEARWVGIVGDLLTYKHTVEV